MKHSMAVKLLVAGVCALGTAAAAQSDANPNADPNAAAPRQQGSQGTMESAPAETPTGYGSDSEAPTAAPNKNMTMSEKKQSLDNIKKAIRDSETQQGRASASGEQGTSAETGSMSSKPMGVQHLKVFRRGDKVVLRGTVRSQEEKDRIGSVAEGAANGEQIVNELKVK